MPSKLSRAQKEALDLMRRLCDDGFDVLLEIAARNVRRDAIQNVKEMLKEKTATEDEARRAEDEIQKLTDKYVKEVDDAVKAKEQELMAV